MKFDKPMIKTQEQIEYLKCKDISFKKCSEQDAARYLRENNNYFKLTSYRKNYDKCGDKYIKLDFGYLKDLAIIDMKLRYVLVQLALDIEHYAKMEILRSAEENQEDGYTICEDFRSSMLLEQQTRFQHEMERNKNSIYCRDLFIKYQEQFPIWVMLELIPFGRMISFYGFCAKRFYSKEMQDRYFLLKTCKEIRNAAAHSSCILNDLRANTKSHNNRYEVMKELSKIKGISQNVRKKRMSNARIQQIVTLLYTHGQIVTSEGVRKKAGILLQDFEKRMMKNIDYYETNDLIKANFRFLESIIDNWYCVV